MLQHKRYVVKVVVFLVLLSLCLTAVNRVLIPKYYYNGDWPATSTYLDFYNMEKNTVDVLFLGSSHCSAAFSPVELYEKYGIKSYNLGCEQQNILLSYYWLREALRYQSPKYVFLDTFMLFPYDETSVLNTSEPTTRKAMDFMRWSGVKLQAVRDICKIDKEQSMWSYIFPAQRFHTRWKGLWEDDFTLHSMGAQETLMGFFPIQFECNRDDFCPFTENYEIGSEEMVPVMREYLDKLTMLCREEGIELVLTKTPSMFYSQKAHNAVNIYAYENDLEYIDFNEEKVYDDADLKFAQDSCDTDHVSISGAVKVSDYIGEWLQDKVPCGVEDSQWELREQYYEHCLKDSRLKDETDLGNYLQMIKDENYAVLITVNGDASELLVQEAEGFRSLGLHPEWAASDGDSYYAVLEEGEVICEETGRVMLHARGTLRNGLVTYEVISGGTDGGSTCSILLDGGEMTLKHWGINVAVYCNEKKRLVDRVCFFEEDGKVNCTR